MPASAIDVFIANLTKSRLLSDEQLAGLQGQIDRADGRSSAQEVAAILVEQRLLTHWQAGMLLAGHPGFFLGKYKLLKELGHGGMGAVFQAQHATLQRIVALKVMAPHLLLDRRAVSRFHREIQAVAALDDPHIVAAYDAESVGDTHFLVMEYVSGKTLAALVKGAGSLPIPEACEYILQAALGLQHAHERGMTHRDIKPSNLLLTQTSDGGVLVKILDMGLARFASESGDDGGLTKTGQIMGTPDYIAPEQAQNTKSADIRSDIFSLGCTLFRLLTGRVPFGGDNVMEKLMARTMNDAPRLRTLRPDAPPKLESIVARMLARNPADRIQVPMEVATALAPFASKQAAPRPPRSDLPELSVVGEEFIPLTDPGFNEFLKNLALEAQDEPAANDTSQVVGSDSPDAPTESVRPRAIRMSRRGRQAPPGFGRVSRRQWALTAILVGTMAAAGIGSWSWYRSAETMLVVDWPLEDRAGGTLEVDGRTIGLTDAGALRFSGRPGKRSAVIGRAGYEERRLTWNLARGEEIVVNPEWKPLPATLRKLEFDRTVREVDRLLASAGPIRPVASNDTVRKVAEQINSFRHRWPGTVEARSATSLLSRLPAAADALRRDSIPKYEMTVAGDGDPGNVETSIVAVLGDGRLRHSLDILTLAITPDGKTLVSLSADGTLRAWDSSTGRQTAVLRANGVENGDAPRRGSTSCDGRVVGFRTHNGHVAVCRITDQPLRWNHDFYHGSASHQVTIDHDGQVAALLTDDGSITLFDVVNGRPVQSFLRKDSSNAGLGSVAFSPDGKLLAAFAADPAGSQIVVCSRAEGKVQRTIRTRRPAGRLMFSPDSTLVAGAQSAVTLWNAATGEVVWDLEASDSLVEVVQFSPGGGTLLLGGSDGTISLRQVADGQEFSRLQSHGGGIGSLVIDSDERLVAAAVGSEVELWHRDEHGKWHAWNRGSDVLEVFTTPEGGLAAIQWRNRSTVQLVDVLTGREFWVLDTRYDQQPTTAVTPDGRLLALRGEQDAIRIVDMLSGKILCELFASPGTSSPLVFSPDGSLLATMTPRGELRLWSTATGKPFGTNLHRESGVMELHFVADERRIALAFLSGEIRVTGISETVHRRILRSEIRGLQSAAIRDDGRTVALGDDWGSISLWDVETGRMKQPLHPKVYSTCGAWRLTFSPDGRWLAGAIRVDGTIVVYDVSDISTEPVLRASLGAPVGLVNKLEFTPEGRHLICYLADRTIYVLRLAEWKPKSD